MAEAVHQGLALYDRRLWRRWCGRLLSGGRILGKQRRVQIRLQLRFCLQLVLESVLGLVDLVSTPRQRSHSRGAQIDDLSVVLDLSIISIRGFFCFKLSNSRQPVDLEFQFC